MGSESRPKQRCQWEGPVGLVLVAVFFLLGLPLILFATILEIGIGHSLFVLVTTASLWVSYSGLRRGDFRNRFLSLLVHIFFLWVVILLYLRGYA